jgi:cytochrome c551/c552
MRKILATGATLLTAVAIMVLASGQTMANPAIAQKTGKACNACHTTPPALNDAGKKYKAQGK